MQSTSASGTAASRPYDDRASEAQANAAGTSAKKRATDAAMTPTTTEPASHRAAMPAAQAIATAIRERAHALVNPGCAKRRCRNATTSNMPRQRLRTAKSATPAEANTDAASR